MAYKSIMDPDTETVKRPIPAGGNRAPIGNEGSLLLDPAARSAVKGAVESVVNYNGIARPPGNFKIDPPAVPAPISAPNATVYEANKEAFQRDNANPSGGSIAPASRPAPPGPTSAVASIMGPGDLSRMSDGSLPTAARPAPITTPVTAPLENGQGSGYLEMGGKRVNYQDIGGKSDPFNDKNISGAVRGQALNSNSIADDLISQRRAFGQDAAPTAGAAAAAPISAMPAPLSEYQRSFVGEANASNPSYVNAMAQKSIYLDKVAQVTADRSNAIGTANAETGRIKGIADANESDVRAQLAPGIAATSNELRKAQATDALSQGKLREAQSTPEWQRASKAKDAADAGAKDYKELTKTYYSSIKDLTLPQGWEGKHMELAKDLANADDPSSDFGIYFAPGQNRSGIATRKSVFDPLLSKYRLAGYPETDAHAHAYSDLQGLEKEKGMKLSKPFPNLDRLLKNNRKPIDELTGV